MATTTKPKAKATGGPMILEWDESALCWTRGDGQGGLLDAGEQEPWPRGKERWPTSGTLALTPDGWVMVPRD